MHRFKGYTKYIFCIKCNNNENQDKEAVIAIPNGELLEGEIPSNKMKLVQAWIEIHREDLWDLHLK
ncbi:DUF4160 domain-containing protein [candidate division KSB1 bacterium]|nr:DUF4160 domain-containing protein [candidate division KSB1 bacterium]